MSLNEFNEFASNRILQAVITVEGKKYPSTSLKYPPLCYLLLDDLSIKVKRPLTSYLLFTAKKLIGEIKYKDISHIKISAVQKLTNIVSFGVGTVILPEFIITLKDGFIFHLDCESMDILPGIIRQLTKKKVKIVDPLELIDKCSKDPMEEEGHKELREYIERIAEKKGINLMRESSLPNIK